MTHIRKQEKNKIFYTLLMDGVISAKQEYWGTHQDTNLENAKVLILLKTLHSKGYVDVVFNWRHYYYTLNNNGINYIKNKLGITEQKVQPRTRAPRSDAMENAEGENRGGDRRGRVGGARATRRPREEVKPKAEETEEKTEEVAAQE